LHPAIRIVWWVEASMLALPVMVGALVIDLGLSLPWPRWILSVSIAVVALVLAALLPVVRYRNWGYELRRDDLWISYGVFWHKVTVIPYIRLQFVDTKQGPLERLLGLSQLVVHTAAVGTSGLVPGLTTQAATELRQRLSQLEGDTGGL
jgi:membrane protein YdbS with pleckstrin-like domain